MILCRKGVPDSLHASEVAGRLHRQIHGAVFFCYPSGRKILIIPIGVDFRRESSRIPRILLEAGFKSEPFLTGTKRLYRNRQTGDLFRDSIQFTQQQRCFWMLALLQAEEGGGHVFASGTLHPPRGTLPEESVELQRCHEREPA